MSEFTLCLHSSGGRPLNIMKVKLYIVKYIQEGGELWQTK